jgi:hypothetical protein
MPLEMASNNAKTSLLFHDFSEGMKHVHLTLKTAVQNRQETRDRMKIDEQTIFRQISAFKASFIQKLDELENSANSQSGFYLSNGKRRIQSRKVSFFDRKTCTTT